MMRETTNSSSSLKIGPKSLGVLRFSTRAFLTVVLIGLVSSVSILRPSVPGAFAVSAYGQEPKKRKPPAPPPSTIPPPSNLRITGITSSSVALAWDPSPFTGSFIYVVQFSGGLIQNLPQTKTSLVWTDRLTLGQSYSFLVYVVDFANNKSANSNTVTAAIPRSPTPFTAPVVTVSDIGVRHISLEWLATGGTPSLRYLIFKDGVLLNQQPTADRAETFYLLQPDTTYTFTVQARDYVGNLSPTRDIAVRTRPSNPDDVTPPTAPAPLEVYHQEGDLEMSLFWTASVDDFDAQSVIRYDIYVNGVLEDIVIGRNQLQTLYGVSGVNTITVIAVDTAGNQSAPATVTVNL